MFRAITTFFASLGIIGFLAYFALCIAGVIGWVMNVWQVIGLAKTATTLTVWLALKVVGIFAFPLGAVLGWL